MIKAKFVINDSFVEKVIDGFGRNHYKSTDITWTSDKTIIELDNLTFDELEELMKLLIDMDVDLEVVCKGSE